jgi:hypothetical protein
MLLQSSGSKNKPSKKSASEQVASNAFTLVSCLAYSSTLKMEATSSKTLVGFQQTTRYYISENRNLHNHHCENLKSYPHPVSSSREKKKFTLFVKKNIVLQIS